MTEYEHLYQLTAIKLSGPPIKEIFTSLGPRPNGETYEFNPSLLGLLQGKQFKGDGMEDPYQHVQLFDEMCMIFKINSFTYDENKLKLFW